MTERRQQTQRRVKSVPATVTIDRELMDFIDVLLQRRAFKSRSHVVNAALDYLKWTLENEPNRFFGQRVAPVKSSPIPPQPHNRDRLPPR
jgi:hypothetical protein